MPDAWVVNASPLIILSRINRLDFLENLAPAALLDLDDRFAVIRAQAPTAVVLLLVNTVLMHVLAFPAHP